MQKVIAGATLHHSRKENNGLAQKSPADEVWVGFLIEAGGKNASELDMTKQ